MFIPKILFDMGKSKLVARENINLFLVNGKMNTFMEESGIEKKEEKCRMVKMTLRHHVHHFPVNIPFIAVVKACNDDQNIVFSVKRKKMAVIPSIAISSETNVDSFEIDGIIYEQQDTMNGFPRYIETKK